MTTREFIQHLLLNSEMDDEVEIEVLIPEGYNNRYICFNPAHVTRIDNNSDKPVTLIDCKPAKEYTK